MAERLGEGMQNLLQRFKSASDLREQLSCLVCGFIIGVKSPVHRGLIFLSLFNPVEKNCSNKTGNRDINILDKSVRSINKVCIFS